MAAMSRAQSSSVVTGPADFAIRLARVLALVIRFPFGDRPPRRGAAASSRRLLRRLRTAGGLIEADRGRAARSRRDLAVADSRYCGPDSVARPPSAVYSWFCFCSFEPFAGAVARAALGGVVAERSRPSSRRRASRARSPRCRPCPSSGRTSTSREARRTRRSTSRARRRRPRCRGSSRPSRSRSRPCRGRPRARPGCAGSRFAIVSKPEKARLRSSAAFGSHVVRVLLAARQRRAHAGSLSLHEKPRQGERRSASSTARRTPAFLRYLKIPGRGRSRPGRRSRPRPRRRSRRRALPCLPRGAPSRTSSWSRCSARGPSPGRPPSDRRSRGRS
jgi:hypothetical protein